MFVLGIANAAQLFFLSYSGFTKLTLKKTSTLIENVKLIFFFLFFKVKKTKKFR